MILLASFAVYLVAMNVFLRTRLFRDAITSSNGSLLVEYRSAYSLWPGRIHVEGLIIRGRDGSVEWILLLDRCDFRVSFAGLARKRFHASHVDGDGLSLRVRLRRDGPVTPEEMRALPPVPGFLDPPLADVGPPPTPLTDENYNLWSIQLDDVDANHVRELWIDTTRYAGDLEVRGRWFFRPLRWLDIGPATIDLRALEVGHGMVQPWVSGATGKLVATIHPFSLQDVVGADTLERISVDGGVRGTLRVANVLDDLLEAPDPGLTATRADDTALDAQVHVDHGVLRPGTALHVDPFAAAVHSRAIVVEGTVTADARVDDDGTVHVAAGSSNLRATPGVASRSLRAASLAAIATSRDVDLARVGEDLRVEGSVEGKEVVVRFDGATVASPSFSMTTRSLRFRPGTGPLTVNRVAVRAPDIELPLSLIPNALLLLPKVVSIEGGRARVSVSADIDVEHKAATGEALVITQGLRARLGDEAIDGDLHIDVRARESNGSTALSGSTLAFNGTVGDPPAPWWARATLPQALLDARGGLRFRGQIAANAKDASPLAAIVAKNTAIPRWILSAISTDGLVATGQLVVSPSTFQARSVTARSAGIDLGFELAQLGTEQEWALLLDVGAVSAGIDASSNSATDVLLFGAKPWFEKKTASLRAVERRYE